MSGMQYANFRDPDDVSAVMAARIGGVDPHQLALDREQIRGGGLVWSARLSRRPHGHVWQLVGSSKDAVKLAVMIAAEHYREAGITDPVYEAQLSVSTSGPEMWLSSTDGCVHILQDGWVFWELY